MFTQIKDKFDTTPNKGMLFVLCTILVIVVTLIAIILLNGLGGKGTTAGPIPTPTAVPRGASTQRKINPAQKTVIEQTTQNEVQTLPSVESKSPLPDGATRYTLKSPLSSRKNEIIVKDNHVVFERMLVPESSKAPGYVRISEYEKEYGKPQQIIRGSHFYGNLIKTYIYADKGFAFIGNSFTDEVFEIHTFKPTTIENYITQYGEDINKSAPAGES